LVRLRGFGSGDSTVTGGSRSRATGATLCASAGGTKTNMDAAAENIPQAALRNAMPPKIAATFGDGSDSSTNPAPPH